MERVGGQFERTGGLHEVVKLAARLDLHDGEEHIGVVGNIVLRGVIRHGVAVGDDRVRNQAVGDVTFERTIVRARARARAARSVRRGRLSQKQKHQREHHDADEQNEQLTAACAALAALAAACGRSGTGTHVLRRSRTAHRRTMAAVFMLFSGFSYAF